MITDRTTRAIEQLANELDTNPKRLHALQRLEGNDRTEAAHTIATILRGFLRLSEDVQRAIIDGHTESVFSTVTEWDQEVLEMFESSMQEASQLFNENDMRLFEAEPMKLYEEHLNVFEGDDLKVYEDTCTLCGQPLSPKKSQKGRRRK